MEIFFAILVLGFLGLLFGVGLAVASKKLAVHVDEKVEKVFHLLPGANCGACGNPGCFGFAESLVGAKVAIDACRVSNDACKEQIAKVLGTSLEKKVRKTAVLHCNGGAKVKDKYIYSGMSDCLAANFLLGGNKACVFGCLGFGTCAKVCPFGAISMSQEGLPVIDKDKCRACNKCVSACPKKLISLVPVSGVVTVCCNSHDFGKEVKAVCSVGCIGCKLCEKACKFGALSVIDNLAVIDYHKCTSCGACVKVCPTQAIRASVKP
jgi:Na+-translocating ferredoxin:NAD+ oxidoreductase RNF subunit RnfB